MLTPNGSGFNRLDRGCTVMGINNGVSDPKIHMSRTPFDVSMLTRACPKWLPSSQVRAIDPTQ
ncbi:hypothetical protein GCM10011410_32070 [Hoyosella rhizosphaerae]|uniref:Uncharacterized protein n=1 Tax=Hoyosella rhizosphaerae TaxID=1755582 RepID=A0A916ULH0_9ACTN|nr:hypothetical protein GCM10011410_32070 [Hoyosella rhizosphaerae]